MVFTAPPEQFLELGLETIVGFDQISAYQSTAVTLKL
jgi:hypothetical protein